MNKGLNSASRQRLGGELFGFGSREAGGSVDVAPAGLMRIWGFAIAKYTVQSMLAQSFAAVGRRQMLQSWTGRHERRNPKYQFGGFRRR